MNRDDIQKLLGGYATGTLTEAERKALFDAALHDQSLFDALAGEESLRQLLRDPSAKAELLRAVEPAPRQSPWTSWLRRPMGWAALGSLAAGIALLTIMLRPEARHNEPHLAELRDEVSKPELMITQPQPKAPPESSARTQAKPARKQARSPETQPPKPRAAAAPPPAVPVRQRESDVAESAAKSDSEVFVRRSASVPTALNLAPTGPMSAVATFRQTAPLVSADAAEVRAEKARSGAGLTALRSAVATPSTAAVMSGVRYEIQQRAESGSYQRVDPDLPLRSAAPFRLEAETNKAGYLYAFETGPEGVYRQLSIGPTVDPHVKHTVELGEPAPGRKLLLIFSTHPQAAFTVGAATEGAAQELDRLRAESAARPAIRQKWTNSVYVVGPAGTPALLIEIGLPAVQ